MEVSYRLAYSSSLDYVRRLSKLELRINWWWFSFPDILYHAQDNLLYHPDLPSNSRVYIPVPAMHNLPYETVNIRTSDNATLHAFFIKQNDDKSTFVPTIVYFHGNAGNMGHRLQNVWGIYYNLNCNILMVEYRGYGLSTGSPSEKGLCMDGRAAVDYLYTRHDLDHQKIILFGRSLGGAVAIDVAADLEYSGKIMALMVENTFTSIPDMAVELVHPNVKYLPNVFYKNKVCSSWISYREPFLNHRKIKFHLDFNFLSVLFHW